MLTIGCTIILTTCFMDGLADLPICFDHRAIDSFVNLLLCMNNVTAHLSVNIFYLCRSIDVF